MPSSAAEIFQYLIFALLFLVYLIAACFKFASYLFVYSFTFKIGFCCLVQAGPELVILLLASPEYLG